MVVIRAALFLALVCVLMFSYTDIARAHWDLDSRFWQDDEEKDRFFLRIHNGTHANRKPVRRKLNVCFWLEVEGNKDYTPVSDKQCSMVVIEPDGWKNFSFELNKLSVHEDVKNTDRLKKGNYRAVVVAREQKGMIARLLFGAVLERLYSYFEVKE